MKKISFLALAVLFAVYVLSSCNKETNDNTQYSIPAHLKLLASGYANGAAARVDVYAADSFFTGFNNLYFALYDSVNNERLTSSHVELIPMMSMIGGMNHSAPIENPTSDHPTDALFAGAVVYTMPSSTGNTWMLNVSVENEKNNLGGIANLDINVLQPSRSVMKSITALDNNDKLFISLVKPLSPKVGVNDFEVTIHRKESMMSFPPTNEYTTEINPQMLSMGHGSPLNESPVSVGNGHYTGKVNFTMSGDWRVFLKLNHNGAIADSTLYFDMYLP